MPLAFQMTGIAVPSGVFGSPVAVSMYLKSRQVVFAPAFLTNKTIASIDAPVTAGNEESAASNRPFTNVLVVSSC